MVATKEYYVDLSGKPGVTAFVDSQVEAHCIQQLHLYFSIYMGGAKTVGFINSSQP